MGDKAYYAEQNEDGGYSFLRGPDGFECCLGEPEDCTWYRDGKPAVERLNQQHEALTACSLRYASLLAVLRKCVGLLEVSPNGMDAPAYPQWWLEKQAALAAAREKLKGEKP